MLESFGHFPHNNHLNSKNDESCLEKANEKIDIILSIISPKIVSVSVNVLPLLTKIIWLSNFLT